jgi:hypothetical protein
MKATRKSPNVVMWRGVGILSRKHLVLEARTDGDYARDKVVFVLVLCFWCVFCTWAAMKSHREDSDFEERIARHGCQVQQSGAVCVEPDGKVYLRHP